MNLKEIALQKTTGSALMVNKEKITTDDIISNGGIITINACDELQTVSEDNSLISYFVVNMIEFPGKYYLTGSTLSDILKTAITELGVEEVNNELQQEGLRVRLEKRRTKRGRIAVGVEVL